MTALYILIWWVLPIALSIGGIVSIVRSLKALSDNEEGSYVPWTFFAAILYWIGLGIFNIHCQFYGNSQEWAQFHAEQAYWRIWNLRWIQLTILPFGAVFAFLLINWIIAKISLPRIPREVLDRKSDWGDFSELRLRTVFGIQRTLVLAGAVAIACLVGILPFIGKWRLVVQYKFSTLQGWIEPLHGKDASFYMQRLPMYDFISTWIIGVIFAGLVFTAFIYLYHGWKLSRANDVGNFLTRDQEKRMEAGLWKHAFIHWGFLLALLGVGLYYRFIIAGYDLTRAEYANVIGAGYIQTKVLLGMYHTMGTLSLILGGIVLLTGFIRRWWPIVGSIILYGILAFTLLVCVPAYRKSADVKPNEFRAEETYLPYSMKATRIAYGFANPDTTLVTSLSVIPQFNLTANDLRTKHQETINAIRIWDWRPLVQYVNNMSANQRYYRFHDVDVDRYQINGKRENVMISFRELNVDNLKGSIASKFNRRLRFTHGYGCVMNGVNEFINGGQPRFIVSEIPPKSEMPLDMRHWGIYFDESAGDDYVFVNTSYQEFDYPTENGEVLCPLKSWEGETGIRCGSMWNRLKLGMRFGDEFWMIRQKNLTDESRMLVRRNIKERVKNLYTFLSFDEDVQQIIGTESGRLYYMWDAYTVSSTFPYSAYVGKINYLRNSVKIVVDAYGGGISAYV